MLPADNAPELELLPEEVLAGLKFVPVHTMDEVLAAALTSVPDVQKALLEGVHPLELNSRNNERRRSRVGRWQSWIGPMRSRWG